MRKKLLFYINDLNWCGTQKKYVSPMLVHENSHHLFFFSEENNIKSINLFNKKNCVLENDNGIYVGQINTYIPMFRCEEGKEQISESFVFNDLYSKSEAIKLPTKKELKYKYKHLKSNFFKLHANIAEQRNINERARYQKINQFFFFYFQKFLNEKLNFSFESMTEFLEQFNLLVDQVNVTRIKSLFDIHSIIKNFIFDDKRSNSQELEARLKNNYSQIKVIRNIVDKPSLSYDNLNKIRNLKEEIEEIKKTINKRKKFASKDFDQMIFQISVKYKTNIKNNESLLRYRQQIYSNFAYSVRKQKNKFLFLSKEQFKNFENKILSELYFFTISKNNYSIFEKQNKKFPRLIANFVKDILDEFIIQNKKNQNEFKRQIDVIKHSISTNHKLISWNRNNLDMHNLFINKYYSYYDDMAEKKWIDNHQKTSSNQKIKLNNFLLDSFLLTQRKKTKENKLFLKKIKNILKENHQSWAELENKFDSILEKKKIEFMIDKLEKDIIDFLRKYKICRFNSFKKFVKAYRFLNMIDIFNINPEILVNKYKFINEFNSNKIILLSKILENQNIIQMDLSKINLDSPFGAWFYSNVYQILNQLNCCSISYVLINDNDISKKLKEWKIDWVYFVKNNFILNSFNVENQENFLNKYRNYEKTVPHNYVNIIKENNLMSLNYFKLKSKLDVNNDETKKVIIENTNEWELSRYVHEKDD
ncbi:hypothetical protein [Mycoplasma elephantis]|uniref:hypothetical protein n=1 Tax=Mycoplasma elephantis TaxID=114882 RepID=UPI00048635F9|nr:hypothetical protein [Mycoplasma elephantis]